MATFGGRLRRLRQEKELKQTELAKLLNLESSSTISQYENEALNRIPDAQILQSLAEIFDCSVDYLLGRTNIRKEVFEVKDGSSIYNIDKIKNAVFDDPELLSFWQELSQREDLKILMRQVRDMKPKGVKKIIRLIKAVEDEEDSEEF